MLLVEGEPFGLDVGRERPAFARTFVPSDPEPAESVVDARQRAPEVPVDRQCEVDGRDDRERDRENLDAGLGSPSPRSDEHGRRYDEPEPRELYVDLVTDGARNGQWVQQRAQ